VNVGEAKGALLVSIGCIWSALATVVPTPIVAVPFIGEVVDANAVIELKLVPVATPIFGVTKVGLVANTLAPVPVSSVRAVAN
jgi:hypothetical protein